LIDFRYHLVSLVAVFLALAVGIVLGAGPLNDTLGNALEKQTKALSTQKRDLQSQVSSLQNQVGYGEDVASDLVAPMVYGRLTGQRVVVIQLPGADGKLVNSLTRTLVQAGATVSGAVRVESSYVDPSKSVLVGDLASRLAPSYLQMPITGPYDAAALLLAESLVTRVSDLSGRPDTESVTVFSGYTQAGLLKVAGSVDRRADLALVVAPGAPASPSDTTDAANQALLPLVSDLADAGHGVLVAGPVGSAGDGGFVRAVRGDHDARARVSTEDMASQPSGQIGTVLGLVEQAQGGVGHYGNGPGTTGALPQLTPLGTPVASTTSSSSPSPSSR